MLRGSAVVIGVPESVGHLVGFRPPDSTRRRGRLHRPIGATGAVERYEIVMPARPEQHRETRSSSEQKPSLMTTPGLGLKD